MLHGLWQVLAAQKWCIQAHFNKLADSYINARMPELTGNDITIYGSLCVHMFAQDNGVALKLCRSHIPLSAVSYRVYIIFLFANGSFGVLLICTPKE